MIRVLFQHSNLPISFTKNHVNRKIVSRKTFYSSCPFLYFANHYRKLTCDSRVGNYTIYFYSLMPRIEINTEIDAPINVVFDLSRSIDFHMKSTEHTGEKAVAGKTSGLIGLNESVTWKAKHFGISQHLTSKITVMRRPDIFVDEMTKGAFKWFSHQHLFLEENGKTILIDIFEFESPCGILGKMANRLFLKSYMKRLLTDRNEQLKTAAENGAWKEYVSIPL